MVGADRLIGRSEFRLRPAAGWNKARWGLDSAGTVELVDKRSVFGCDPASLTQKRLRLRAFPPHGLTASGSWERNPQVLATMLRSGPGGQIDCRGKDCKLFIPRGFMARGEPSAQAPICAQLGGSGLALDQAVDGKQHDGAE